MPRLLLSCLALATIAAAACFGVADAEQTCPGVLPWRLKCPQYCCVSEFDEPLEGQYCCESCRSSFDAGVRHSFACTSSHYLHKTWAVVLMACGIAFTLLGCCTCCCCCCCAPCRRSRRHGRAYTLVKSPQQLPAYRQLESSNERAPLLTRPPQRPSAPPAAMTSSQTFAHYPQKAGATPPPYQEASAAADAPPTYRP